ncbi:hypothetical protein KAU32_09495 [bacterium]|nr:hypothetical protein [bacterium]
MNTDSEKILIRKLIHKERCKRNEISIRKTTLLILFFSVILFVQWSINMSFQGPGPSRIFLLISSLILFFLYLPIYIFRNKINYNRNFFFIVIFVSMLGITFLQINELLYFGYVCYAYVLTLMVILALLIIPPVDIIIFLIASIVSIGIVLSNFTPDKDQLLFSLPRVGVTIVIIYLLAILRNLEFEKSVRQMYKLEEFKRDIEIKNKMLDSSVKKLKDADLLKTEYVSNISHELKTPITILSGYVDLLKNDDRLQDSRSQKRLSTMEKNVRRLFNTVSDLFNMGELDKEHETVTMENFSAIEIFNPLAEEFSEVCEKEGRIFKATLADIEIKGNPSQISIVLENLLLNALKFTETGNAISVNIIDEKGGRVRLSVEDDAIAIPKEEQKKIFEKFYQSGGGLDRKFPGTGLGLYISQKILREHGSKLFIKSEGDFGVEFFFYLELA